MRPPTPLVDPQGKIVDPQGKIKVYLVDAEDGELLIYAYEELPELWELKWERYVARYNCTVKVVISTQ